MARSSASMQTDRPSVPGRWPTPTGPTRRSGSGCARSHPPSRLAASGPGPEAAGSVGSARADLRPGQRRRRVHVVAAAGLLEPEVPEQRAGSSRRSTARRRAIRSSPARVASPTDWVQPNSSVNHGLPRAVATGADVRRLVVDRRRRLRRTWPGRCAGPAACSPAGRRSLAPSMPDPAPPYRCCQSMCDEPSGRAEVVRVDRGEVPERPGVEVGEIGDRGRLPALLGARRLRFAGDRDHGDRGVVPVADAVDGVEPVGDEVEERLPLALPGRSDTDRWPRSRPTGAVGAGQAVRLPAVGTDVAVARGDCGRPTDPARRACRRRGLGRRGGRRGRQSDFDDTARSRSSPRSSNMFTMRRVLSPPSAAMATIRAGSLGAPGFDVP